MIQYINALKDILKNGEDVSDRTGTGTRTIFGLSMRFDLSEGFPAVTTKKLAWRAVTGELLWFIEGSEDERRLAEITYENYRENLTNNKTIWTANADKQGVELGYENSDEHKYLGPVYGAQWRCFNDEFVDQFTEVIRQINDTPDSRRIILSAWNPAALDKMALPPCHVMSQFRVINGKLSCQMYQRSADFGLGVPFNIASYALLTHMLAQICNLEVGELVHVIGDAHIYNNHIEQIKEQVQRKPGKLPTLKMPEFSDVYDLLETQPSSYILENYNPQASIKMDMSA